MSLESSPKQEKPPEKNMKEIADEALVGIENAWENYVEEQLEAHARAYGEALFRMARSTADRERMRYADGFSHFLSIIKKDTAEKVLESLLTNPETVKELQRKAREELEDLRGKSKNFFSRWWKND